MEILRVEDLTFRYPTATRPAVEGLSLSIREGEFLLICGRSGCGKTTLLRLLKRELAPVGDLRGRILYDGIPQADLDPRRSAGEIGFVLQNPDGQIVTDKVWHELAFGPENLGLPTPVIRRRVGEMASYFGVGHLFREKTDVLSGGEKQLVSLAAVCVMGPRLLILDEPTGQLDPIAAENFLSTLQKLNRELGITVILAEHRLESVFPMADRVLVMEDGRAVCCGDPRQVGAALRASEDAMQQGLPSAVRIWQALSPLTGDGVCPLTVREGRDYLESNFPLRGGVVGGESDPADRPADFRDDAPADPALEMDGVWFRYEKDSPDILRGTSLRVNRGEIFCLLGGNGAGKTTALNVLSGLSRPYRGKVRVDGKPIRAYGASLYRSRLALLPQNPQTVFVKDRVSADFVEILAAMEVQKADRGTKIAEMAEKLGITPLLEQHPYDLSGGEQQKCALGKVLLTKPTILLLDEPTKGLDAHSKAELGDLLRGLRDREGLSVLIVTHDVEFAAEYADRCALFFDGEVLSADSPRRFFSDNRFYTTAASRMARRICRDAVTCAQVIESCAKVADPARPKEGTP